jgi:hypothetical protein
MWPQKFYVYSNPIVSQRKAYRYLGRHAKLYPSTSKNKKYMIKNPSGKWIHFGLFPYEDFNKHKDEERRNRYLLRAENMRGNWRDNPYSPNNLSIHILW